MIFDARTRKISFDSGTSRMVAVATRVICTRFSSISLYLYLRTPTTGIFCILHPWSCNCLFLADCTNGCAYASVPSVCRRRQYRYVLWLYGRHIFRIFVLTV